MRRSRFALVLALIGLLTVGSAASGASPSGATSSSRVLAPEFARPDKDLLQEAATRGQKVTGKRIPNPGNSYKSPGKDGPLGHIDVRGHGRRGLAILVDWPETTPGVSEVPGVDYPPLPQQLFNDLVNGDTYNPYDLPMFSWLSTYGGQPAPTNLTMKNYYNEVSYGQFSMTVDMVGWVTMPKPYEYYLGQNKGYYNDNGDAHMGDLLRDALAAADALGVDFSQYAVDAVDGDFWWAGSGDSFDHQGQTITQIVPNLFIIHRGTGAEYSLDPSIIWSHKWDIASATWYSNYFQNGTFLPDSALIPPVYDGVAMNVYNIVPEVGQDITEYFTGPLGLPRRPPSPPYVGVFAHEFGHVLGLPDLYDYGYDSEGVGIFSLMASGSYGRSIQNRWYSGNSPSHMDPWSKYYLGFVTPTEINPSSTPQSVTLLPVSDSPDIVRVNIPGSNGSEYFMLENRQQRGFDKGLAYTVDTNPGALHGLVVWQVDENVLQREFHGPNDAQNWDPNKRGNNFQDPETGENHYAVSVVQADGRYDMERYFNDGDAGDVFPGKTGKTVLLSTPMSAPNTLSWNVWADGRSVTGIELRNIVEHADGTITLDVVYK